MVETSSSPTPTNTGGDETAAPRPRRRREQSEASAFLSKTYAMIDALPAEIGGWSTAGDSMVILDAETFASEIIPQYFKHNNFRSFVRQLNFYGFRKLRADASSGAGGANRWEFKHCNFRRGHPELLVQIRRAEHYDYSAPDAAAQRQRQSELERDVADLRQRVGDMQTQLDDLTQLTSQLRDALFESNNGKKRKSGTPMGGSIEGLPSIGPVPALGPHSLDVLASADPIPSFANLEGKPLKRIKPNADAAAAAAAANMDGQPLERRLSTFETSRLDSLIRTLGEDEILPGGGGGGETTGGGGSSSSTTKNRGSSTTGGGGAAAALLAGGPYRSESTAASSADQQPVKVKVELSTAT